MGDRKQIRDKFKTRDTAQIEPTPHKQHARSHKNRGKKPPVCLWAVTFSHSPVPCESHYAYCSHHSGRCCSSLTGSDHSQRLVKLRKASNGSSQKEPTSRNPLMGRGLFFFLPLFLGKRKKKKNDFNGFGYFTLAVNGAADGFLPRWGRGVINMSRLQL